MKTTIKIILIACTLLFFTFFTFDYLNLRKVNRAYKSNTEQLLKDIPDKVLSLTRKDMKNLIKNSNDSILNYLKDSLKFKARNVNKTITHHYYHEYDSSFTITEVSKIDSNYHIFTKNWDQCLEISGRTRNDSIFWDLPIINYEGVQAYYWQRQNRKGKKRPWPWKKKQFAVSGNNCEGNTTTEEINLIKKK